MLDKDHPERVKLNHDRVAHWLNSGAQPTERVIKLCKVVNIKLPKNITKKYDAILSKKVNAHKAKIEQEKKELAAKAKEEEDKKKAEAAKASETETADKGGAEDKSEESPKA